MRSVSYTHLDVYKRQAWYELAAQLGYAPAQYNLGIMLSKGQGCEPDHDRALQWLQKAAEQGLPAAHTALRDISGQDSFQPQDV